MLQIVQLLHRRLECARALLGGGTGNLDMIDVLFLFYVSFRGCFLFHTFKDMVRYVFAC